MKYVTIIEICTKCKRQWKYKVPVDVQPNIYASPIRQAIDSKHCRWCYYKQRYSKDNSLNPMDGVKFVDSLKMVQGPRDMVGE